MRAETYKPDSDLACAAIAERQFGVIERTQALSTGMSTSAIKRRVQAGRWKAILPGVYRIAGTTFTWMTSAMAALLQTGPASCLSHRAAAHVWHLEGFERAPIEVSTPRRLSSKNFVVHFAPDLLPRDVTTRNGIKTTSVHRTLIDLGDVCDEAHVEDALDGALRRHLTSQAYLLKEIERIGTNGRKGAARLRSLLAGEESRPSWLERRFIRLLAGTELPPYEREHPVLRYRIDFAWPAPKLGVEVHGEKWHRKRLQWGRDLARHNELTAGGWTILHFTWPQIRNEPEVVITEIVSTYRRLQGFQF